MKQGNASNKVKSLLFRAKETHKKRGLRYVVLAGIKKMSSQLRISFWFFFYKAFKSWSRFMFQNETYKYFYHKYNTTWRNERTVEIPIIWRIVKGYEGRKVLEVGNVLSHYFTVNHDIIDKYEKAEAVITEDVTKFSPSKKYDLIISISTLEHVGWDENPSDHRILCNPEKIMCALDNLKRLLAPKGRIIVTLPLGYNPFLDKLLKNGKIQFDSWFCLRRISKDNRWIEANWKDVRDSKYNTPFYAGNGLIIGIIKT